MPTNYVSKFSIDDQEVIVKDSEARSTANTASTNATNALNKVTELKKDLDQLDSRLSESIVEIYDTGYAAKNLFSGIIAENVSSVTNVNTDGLNYSFSGRKLRIYGKRTSEKWADFYFYLNTPITVPKGTYTLSTRNAVSGVYGCISSLGSLCYGTSSETVTITEPTTIDHILVTISAETEIDVTYDYSLVDNSIKSNVELTRICSGFSKWGKLITHTPYANLDTSNYVLTLPSYSAVSTGIYNYRVDNRTIDVSDLVNTLGYVAYDPVTDSFVKYSATSLCKDEEIPFMIVFGKKEIYIFGSDYYVNGLPKSIGFIGVGKSIAIMGDSISTYNGISETDPNLRGAYYPHGDLNSQEYMWWDIVRRKCTFDNITGISAISSSAYVDEGNDEVPPAYTQSRVNRIGENGVPEVIFLALGTNDCFSIMAKTYDGEYDDAELMRQYKNTGFALALLIKRLRIAYAYAKIVVLIPKFCNYNNTGGAFTPKNYFNVCNEIKDVATSLGCYVIDLRECRITEELLQLAGNYHTYDGIHPNKDGMNDIADYIIRSLPSILK